MKPLNIGDVANDGKGDTLRDAADKINYNFNQLFDRTTVQNVSSSATIDEGASYIFCESPSPTTLTLLDGNVGVIKRIVNTKNTTLTVGGNIMQGTTVTMTGLSTCAFIWTGTAWALFVDTGISIT